MKLMVDKPEPMKFVQDHGACWVRGGKLYKVSVEHEVHLHGGDSRGPDPRNATPQFAPDQTTALAMVGDLVIEIVSVRAYYWHGKLIAAADEVMGWMYCTGRAVNLSRYTFAKEATLGPIQPAWLAPAALLSATAALAAVETAEEAGAAVLSMRMADADVVAFMMETQDAHVVADRVASWLTAEEVPQPTVDDVGRTVPAPPLERKAEVMGIIRDGNRKKGNTVALHHQTPGRATAWPAGRITIGLCATSREAADMAVREYSTPEPHPFLRSVP
jgi:hypothetical protein